MGHHKKYIEEYISCFLPMLFSLSHVTISGSLNDNGPPSALQESKFPLLSICSWKYAVNR